MSDQPFNFLTPYIKARYSLLCLQTAEETRAEHQILEAAAECSTKGNPMKIWSWSFTTGLREVTKKGSKPIGEDTADPINALQEVGKVDRDTLFVFKDLDPFFDNPMVRRLLRDISRDFKIGKVNDKPLRRTLVLLSPIGTIPEDLKHDISLLELELPGPKILTSMLDNMLDAKPELLQVIGGKEGKEKIIDACRGLTTGEAEDSVCKSIVVRKLDPSSKPVHELVMHEKALALKKTGILEYYPAVVDMKDVGGLETLKSWLAIRKKAFTKEARAFGLPVPRGILLVGVPGAGKSLIAKSAAAAYQVPLIRFDIGRVFGSLVGQSEQNVRTAIKTAEAVGASILWIDELDKAFAGMNSSTSGDSGVSQRVFGNIITWMQEKTTPVFIVATANKTEGLPPELLRKGRFDEIFFVDLPNEKDREEILQIHIKKRRPKLLLDVRDAVAVSKGYSGAELEEAVISGLYRAFDEKTELSEQFIVDALEATVPLSQSRKDDIEKMRAWAANNAVNAAIKAHSKAQAGERIID